MLHQLQLSLQRRVEVVLYVVVSSPRQQLRNLRPPVPQLLMRLYYQVVLLLSPLVLLYVGVQMIVPPLPTLLPNPTRQTLRNLAPVLWPILLHLVYQNLIFFLGPWTLDHGWIQHLLPSMQALDISTVVKERSYSLPVLRLCATG